MIGHHLIKTPMKRKSIKMMIKRGVKLDKTMKQSCSEVWDKLDRRKLSRFKRLMRLTKRSK